MVFPLLTRMLTEGILADAHWFSLNPVGPESASIDGITLHNISLAAEKLSGYGFTKEAIWNMLHGVPQQLKSAGQVLWQNEYSDYTHYNRLSAERIMQLDRTIDFDFFYIHDFQQLPVGHMLRTLKPKMFRWHIPFYESMIPTEWKEFLSGYLNSYDAIMVSCKKYLQTLKALGYSGEARYVYPYIDPSPYTKPARADLDEYCHRFGLRDEDKVVLVVARLDPMKGQNRAIEAVAGVAREISNVKLVMVGNGSFSSSKQGVGLSKAARWLNELQILASKLDIADHVIFAGHLSQAELNAAYERSNLTVLPSIREGFGLVVVESWLFGKPTIVTSRAGISEIIEDGRNGLLFDPDDVVSLAEKICYLLQNPKRARSLGRNGFASSKRCLIDQGAKSESEIILGLV